MSARAGTAAAITGIGLVSPAGDSPGEFFGNLCSGKSGLRRPPEGHPVAPVLDVAGLSAPVDAADVLPPGQGRCVDRFVLLAMAAADRALADAGLRVGQDVDPVRVAVVVATGGGGLETFEQYSHARLDRGRAAVSAYLLPGFLYNMATARIAIKHGIQGFSSTIVTACAAGAHAVAEGLRLIRGGDADVVVCGGSESPLHPTIAAAFANARALANGWEDPAAASRPFDRRRNGFVLSEGAAVTVLERPGHAEGRGQRAYAEVTGWGASTDAHHPTIPRGDGVGASACMRQALASAGLSTADVGYINAHGTSTKLGDAAEATAIRAVFGTGAPPVSSVKAVTGHMLGASGAAEVVATALALWQAALPPTHNLDDPDPACDLDHIRGCPRAPAAHAALSNSFAFGGHNVTIAVGPASRPRPAGEAEGRP